MEPLFKNTYIRNKQTAKEFYRYYFYQRPFCKFDMGLNIVIFVLSLPGALLLDGSFWILTALSVAFPLLNDLRYRISIGTMLRRDIEMFGQEAKITLAIDVDYFQNLEPTESVPMELSKIKKAVRIKNYYILITKTKMNILLHREGFTIGNEEAFESFLKQKGIPLKIVR